MATQDDLTDESVKEHIKALYAQAGIAGREL